MRGGNLALLMSAEITIHYYLINKIRLPILQSNVYLLVYCKRVIFLYHKIKSNLMLLNEKLYSKQIKIKRYTTVVRQTPTYGCEVWSLTKKKLDTI